MKETLIFAAFVTTAPAPPPMDFAAFGAHHEPPARVQASTPPAKTCLCSDRCSCGCNSDQRCTCPTGPAIILPAPVFHPHFAQPQPWLNRPVFAPPMMRGGFGGNCAPGGG